MRFAPLLIGVGLGALGVWMWKEGFFTRVLSRSAEGGVLGVRATMTPNPGPRDNGQAEDAFVSSSSRQPTAFDHPLFDGHMSTYDATYRDQEERMMRNHLRSLFPRWS